MIQDLNPDFRINPDSGPDVCLIALKCCGFTTYLVECCENQPVTVWEVLINVIKSPILQWWAKWKSEPWSVSKTVSPPKVNQFFRGPCNNNTEFQWNRLITLPPHRQNDRRTWSHKLYLGAEKIEHVVHTQQTSSFAHRTPCNAWNAGYLGCRQKQLSHFLAQWSTMSQSHKKEAIWCLIITLANGDRFSKFFYQLIRKKLYMYTSQRFPSHLQYVATLRCEIWIPKNVTEFSR